MMEKLFPDCKLSKKNCQNTNMHRGTPLFIWEKTFLVNYIQHAFYMFLTIVNNAQTGFMKVDTSNVKENRLHGMPGE